MAVDITVVFPGMLPPIIRITPNNPTVWAEPRAAARKIPESDRGTTTVKNLSIGLAPKTEAASRYLSGMLSKLL